MKVILCKTVRVCEEEEVIMAVATQFPTAHKLAKMDNVYNVLIDFICTMADAKP